MVYGRPHRPFVPEFLALHPEVQLQLEMSDARQDLVAEGSTWRCASASWRIRAWSPAASPPCLSTLCAAPAYLAQAGTPAPRRISSATTASSTPCFAAAPSGGCTGPKGGGHHPRGNFEVNNSDAIHTALLAGWHRQHAGLHRGAGSRRRRLVPVLPDHALPSTASGASIPGRRHLPAKVEAWLAFLQERLGLR